PYSECTSQAHGSEGSGVPMLNFSGSKAAGRALTKQRISARRGALLAAALLLLSLAVAGITLFLRQSRSAAAVVVPYPHELAQVSFAVAGDVIPHEAVRAAAKAAGDGEPG